MDAEIDPLIEYAVWSHLESKTDFELILLKGHLMLEIVLDTTLSRHKAELNKKFNFFNKVLALEHIDLLDSDKQKTVVSSLKELNRLRNKLAHEFSYKVDDELELWAFNIHANLEGDKFTRYTCRTKIIHSFSVLSINLLKLTY